MSISSITLDQCRQGLDQAVAILKANLPEFTARFPQPASVNNFYLPDENVEWTTGFSTGSYWLAYEYSGDEAFKKAALVQVDSFKSRIVNRIDVDHHDMGFLYSPSCVAAYKLVGSEIGKEAAILAADNLISRFHEKGQFIQAWGELGATENYRLIVDCLLNLPLLYWASRETGKDVYREKALAHTKTSIDNLIREDYSTYHTFFFNSVTGAPLKGTTAQGYRNGSAWARGQAWAIYGLAISYKETKDPKILDLFIKVTDFFINRLPNDLVPFWDLDFSDSDGEPKDSSAGAIAACGMLEMAGHLDGKARTQYNNIVAKIAQSLFTGYGVKNIKESNGLLLHGVYAKKTPYNTVENNGVDECNLWGDYFYLELLTRLYTKWETYW